ncbi:hypothetical protein Aduo_017937 [Ancylostoma duodenale]
MLSYLIFPTSSEEDRLFELLPFLPQRYRFHPKTKQHSPQQQLVVMMRLDISRVVFEEPAGLASSVVDTPHNPLFLFSVFIVAV